jgi:hypothetical protein
MLSSNFCKTGVVKVEPQPGALSSALTVELHSRIAMIGDSEQQAAFSFHFASAKITTHRSRSCWRPKDSNPDLLRKGVALSASYWRQKSER